MGGTVDVRYETVILFRFGDPPLTTIDTIKIIKMWLVKSMAYGFVRVKNEWLGRIASKCITGNHLRAQNSLPGSKTTVLTSASDVVSSGVACLCDNVPVILTTIRSVLGAPTKGIRAV